MYESETVDKSRMKKKNKKNPYLHLMFIFSFFSCFRVEKMKTRYPFLDHVVNIPKDKLDAIDAIRTWLSFQSHLPTLNGKLS